VVIRCKRFSADASGAAICGLCRWNEERQRGALDASPGRGLEAQLPRSSNQWRSRQYRHQQNQIESLPVSAVPDADWIAQIASGWPCTAARTKNCCLRATLPGAIYAALPPPLAFLFYRKA